MRSVITYLRFSSKPQERGDSIRRQTELFARWLKNNPDAQVVDAFQDEGQSAFHGKHLKGAFGRMLKSIEEKKYPAGNTVLLVESENRLNRQKARTTENIVDLITGSGIDVICLESGKTYNAENIGELGTSIQLKIAAHIAYTQSKEKSDKVSAAWEERTRLAMEGKRLTKMVPGWIDPDTLKLNEHAQTVKTIFELLLEGESLHNIARHLQSNNIKAFSRRKDANGFSVHSVRTILTSESTIGTLAASKHNSRPAIPEYYAAAVDVSTFNKAQEILSKNRKGRTPASDNPITINLFKGLMRCECGSSIHPTGVKSTYQGVYRCNNKVDGRCDIPHMNRKPFDKWMIDNIVGMLEQSIDDKPSKRIAELEYQIEMLSRQITKATALLLSMEVYPELQEQAAELTHQRREKQRELDSLNHHESLSDKDFPQLTDIDLANKAGRVECQLLMAKYVKGIKLTREMIHITFRNETILGASRELNRIFSKNVMKQFITSPDGNVDMYKVLQNDEEFRASGKKMAKRS